MKFKKQFISLMTALTIAGAAFHPFYSAASTASMTESPTESLLELQLNTETEALSESETEAAESILDGADFHYASSYEELYKKLKDAFPGIEESILYAADYDTGFSMAKMEAASESAMNDVPIAAIDEGASVETQDFSDTNRQEADVDEGDIIKTDGTYIYVLRRDCTLVIFKADGASSKQISVTSVSEEGGASICSMYTDGRILTVLLREYVSSLENDDIYYYNNTRSQIRVLTYDISDPKQPVLTGTATQDGTYGDSRKNGRFLYLFTEFYPELSDTFEDSVIVPYVNGEAVPAECIYLPQNLRSSTYLMISSIDLQHPDQILDTKILVSGVSNYYVSPKNIYTANETWDTSAVRTEITKFHYEDGLITGVAAASVRGYLNDSFSMNEYNGNLRVVSTYYGDDYNVIRELVSRFTGEYYDANWTEHNALYILDPALKTLGKIEGLAENETIRSARFMGDTGYFVTFRQTDPLFSVDLSDPSDPKILGKLKIDGFSSYLHFYGENRLLGIGYDADEATGITNGLKLSMFDISDPANVTELHRFVIQGVTWCPSIENYKTILAQPEKNLIGFFCDNRYLLFSYEEEEGFRRDLLYDFYEDMLNNTAEYDTTRGLYINDDFYIAGNEFLLSFAINDGFRKTGCTTVID